MISWALKPACLPVPGEGKVRVYRTSSFAAEPNEPETRILCTVQREEPTLPVRVGWEIEGNSTGENRGQAELDSAHQQTGRESPRWSQSAGCRSGDHPPPPPSPCPPGCANGSPQLSPQPPAHARSRTPGTPTPHRCAAPPGRPPGRGAYVPSNTQITSRATYGSRVLSNMVTGWMVSPPGASGGRNRPRRSRYPIPRAPPSGWRPPQATASLLD